MTRTRSASDVYPTRMNSSYAYHPRTYPAPQPVKRAQIFPWWIWALSPLLTVAVVFAALQVA